MTTNEEYNGFRNYATWLIYSHILEYNNCWGEDSARAALLVVRDTTKAKILLSDQIKTFYESFLIPESNGLQTDLINYMLVDVDWFRLAEKFIDAVKDR